MEFSLIAALLAILLLIILSAIFSATEAAFLSASKAKLYSMSKRGNKRAKLALNLKEKMEKVIATLLVCNNMVNIFASALATSIMISIFQETGVAYATAIMTIMIVIFAEVIPKFYAMRKPESIAMLGSYLLKGIITIFSPITILFEFIAQSVMKLFGIKVDISNMLSSSTDELRGAIDLHQGDKEATEERAMLHSVLDLTDVDVSEVMVHRKDLKSLNIDSDLDDFIAQVVKSRHTRLPVWQGESENIIGIIHTKSLLKMLYAKFAKDETITKSDILFHAKKPWFIPETTTLFEQLQAFRKKREHISLVVDEYGALQGIVTLEDIIEEIVGDIDDEYDSSIAGSWKTNTGDVCSLGITTIRDLNRHYSFTFPDEEAATIAGLIMHKSKVIPKVGQQFKISGHKIKIMRCLRNQVTLVKIYK